MTHMIVPPEDRRPWPTLGPEVCAWMEASLAFGPGDLRGQPYVLDDEDRAFIFRLYEVFPHLHPKAGRRRFNTAVLMLRKGSKKSERAGALAAVELARDGPIRCDGFRRLDGVWVPVGRPVTDPYIPIVAYSEQQAEDTAFDALRVMLSEGPAVDKFDIGLSRIMRARGDGKAEALATAPDSRDGARTTFQIKEEPHRWVLPRQLEAHNTMTANLAKRPLADPWELLPTTAYKPGEGSLAEKLHERARAALDAGDDVASRSPLFFFYRWADDDIDISTPDGLREAIEVASGPILAAWSDIDRIAGQWSDSDVDLAYLERVWLGRLKKATEQAFDARRFAGRADPDHVVPAKALVTLGWHGARYWDAAALVATELETGYQWLAHLDQRPPDRDEWEADEDKATAAVDQMFKDFDVWRLYVNPDRWDTAAAGWAAEYGEDVVLSWRTNQWTHLTRAVRAWQEAVASGDLTHSGDARLAAHVGAAHKRYMTGYKDDDGKPLWVPSKERADSPFPINGVVAAIISWQARLDAIKEGVLETKTWKIA